VRTDPASRRPHIGTFVRHLFAMSVRADTHSARPERAPYSHGPLLTTGRKLA
jgi:hypothetical protein